MEIIYFLLPASLVLALIGLAGYLWAVRSGQFDDLDTPSLRVLGDEFDQTQFDSAKSPEPPAEEPHLPDDEARGA